MHAHTYRNISKRAKTTKYEKEKAYMEQLHYAGATVGQYFSNGQGEREHIDTEDKCDEEAEPVNHNMKRPVGISATMSLLCCSFMIVRQLVSASTLNTSQRLLPWYIVGVPLS